MSNQNMDVVPQGNRQVQQGRMQPPQFEELARAWFVANKRKLVALVGDMGTAQQMMVALVQSVTRTKKLLECRPESLFQCLMQSAATGLFPGPMQECAYLPFKGEAQFVPMIQGLCKLAYNSGHVKGISCAVVYSRDAFEYEEGSNPYVKHKTFLGPRKERGTRLCAYAVIETRQGRMVKVVSMDFIEAIKKRSPGAQFKDSPWNGTEDDYDAMARKTVLKQALKYIPKSSKMQQALSADTDADGFDGFDTDGTGDFAALAARLGFGPEDGALLPESTENAQEGQNGSQQGAQSTAAEPKPQEGQQQVQNSPEKQPAESGSGPGTGTGKRAQSTSA